MTRARAVSIRRGPVVVALFAISAAVLLGITLAVIRPAVAGPEASPTLHADRYLPSISDLMIAAVQPRHHRLWQAAQNKNWDFAAYELGNLQGAFKRIGQAHPTEHDTSFPQMISSVTDQPFAALAGTIKSKDETTFSKAYADLTDGCNACHQALNHGVVMIRVPTGGSISDQDFSPSMP
jgi:hypothetical protein